MVCEIKHAHPRVKNPREILVHSYNIKVHLALDHMHQFPKSINLMDPSARFSNPPPTILSAYPTIQSSPRPFSLALKLIQRMHLGTVHGGLNFNSLDSDIRCVNAIIIWNLCINIRAHLIVSCPRCKCETINTCHCMIVAIVFYEKRQWKNYIICWILSFRRNNSRVYTRSCACYLIAIAIT